jgi:hypothetical protein
MEVILAAGLIGGNPGDTVRLGANSSGHLVIADIALEIDEGTAALKGTTTYNNTGSVVALGTAPKSVMLENTGDYDAEYSWNATNYVPLPSGSIRGFACKNTTVKVRALNVGETATVYITVTA